jgi:hypothetical protein
MNFETLTVSVVVLLAIAAPADANPNWKVFGRSNGGSEIALDTNSFNQSGNTVYFVYRITKNNEPFYHKGRTTDCFVGDSGQSNGHPQLWQSIDNPAEPVNVSADSSASQNMLINVCRSARPIVAKNNREVRQTTYQQSPVDELRRFAGNRCYSILEIPGSKTNIICDRVEIYPSKDKPITSIVSFIDSINDRKIMYTILNAPVTLDDGSNVFEVVGIVSSNQGVPGGTFEFKPGICFLSSSSQRLVCSIDENVTSGRNLRSSTY